MNMDNNYFGDIPLNADKVLFAEDFIYYFLHSNWYSHVDRRDVSNRVGKYRQFIYNGFNQKIKLSVEFIDEYLDCMVLRDFISMKNEDAVNYESFLEYSKRCYANYFPEGFEALPFLIYSTCVTDMAGYFYIHGIQGVLHLAVDCIVKAFPEGDMFSGTWDTLNTAAEMLVKREHDRMESLTPSDSSTDSSDYTVSESDFSEEASESDSSETDSSSEVEGFSESSQIEEDPNSEV